MKTFGIEEKKLLSVERSRVPNDTQQLAVRYIRLHTKAQLLLRCSAILVWLVGNQVLQPIQK